MKKARRILAAVMLFCMIVSMLPPTQYVSAASTVTYELDTDGIDYGEEYLIVSGTSATAYALSSTSAGAAAQVSVTGGTTIGSFAAGPDCLWVFEEASNGQVYIRHGSTYLRIPTSSGSPSYQSSPSAISLLSKGNGAYGMYVRSFMYYYLYRQSSSNQFRITYTFNTNSITGLYLFKKVEDTTCSVTFNGNGNTAGTLPDNAVDLEEGSTYTIPAPSDDFRMDIGDDTYLFWCWTENVDGTGTEYRPGETITVDRDMTLYAQWYLQTKYKVTVVTDLNGAPTDMDTIKGETVNLYIRLDQEGSPLLPLTRTEEGVYVTSVTENGTYLVYAQHGDEEPEEEHGHKVIIYNQDGATELLNYSVSYDLNGGVTQQEIPAVNYHANTQVTATEQIPTMEGYRFLGWEDRSGNLIAPGGVVTDALLEQTVLTAQWEKLVNVTVSVTVQHVSENGQINTDEDRDDVAFLLLQKVGEFDQPYGQIQHLDNTQSILPGEENITRYRVTFENLPNSIYSVGCEKSHYDVSAQSTFEDDQQIIELVLTYAPDNFDLNFQVNVQVENLPEQLRPKSINLRVVRWEGDSWQDLDRLAGSTPITVFLDENGTGTGFLPVWKTDGEDTLLYRVRVSSFVMPDGTVVKAENIQTDVLYKPESAGLYTAEVTVPDGQTPEGAQVAGAYFDGTAQVGFPTVNVTVTPFTVTFDAGDGKLAGETALTLDNQYVYPDLHNYVPVPNEEGGTFSGWYVDGEKAENLAGQYLSGDVTYVAQYNSTISIGGTVFAGSTYEYKGQTITVQMQDRIRNVRVVLQKNINGIYNDVDSRLVAVNYTDTQGEGTYVFDNLPDDGTLYRVYVLQHNYDTTYDNNADGNFTSDEFPVTEALDVDVSLQLNPEIYTQQCIVDTRLIAEGFRPQSVDVQILYRDLGDSLPYNVISQHLVEPYGIQIPLGQDGRGSGSEDVWKWHHNVTLYEYQLNVTKLYGQVAGVFTTEGVDFNENMPFTVSYDMPAYYANGVGEQLPLRATLIPKEYRITFDMNLDDEHGHVQGMDEFHIDTNDNNHYSYFHTWGESSQITAYPYREGYVFRGWQRNDNVIIANGGIIHVGAELAQDITLVAQWEKLEGTDYTVRHLELNTNKVLHGATTVQDSLEGSSVKAVDAVQTIEGYKYVGAMINGTYYSMDKNPELIVSTDPTKNVMVLYYLPDGSDGYTDQVENNLYLDKQAILEDNGTYSIQIETYTKDNPITTLIEQNTPMDIALVLDQSGSMYRSGALDDLQDSVANFISLIADHGREHEVDHRIAVVGYASDEYGGYTNSSYPTAGRDGAKWVNTGVFDSNGDFHIYPVTGFNYTPYTGEITTDGTYYTYTEGEYLLLTFHESYRHLITEDEARKEALNGTTIYGYIDNQFVELTRNTSGLWLYGDKQLYSLPEFFTFHNNVWTHRNGIERRQIHGYIVNGEFQSADGHTGVYTRTETQEAGPQKSIYADALVPVSVGANGSGYVTPGLEKITSSIGGNGQTYPSYGIEMANSVFEANPLDPQEGRIRIMIVFTDGKPGDGSNFDDAEANRALELAYTTTNTYGANIYTIGLYGDDVVDTQSDQDYFMNGLSSNYPNAQTLDDVWLGVTYQQAASGYYLNNNGPYFVEVNGAYYALSLQSKYQNRVFYNCWGYTDDAGNRVNISETPVANGHPIIANGMVAGYTIYRRSGDGYQETPNSGYYAATEDAQELKQYFADIVTELTTKITTEIVLHEDTIVRDIMGQGLILKPGSVITAYKQAGTYNPTTQTVTWTGVNEQLAQVVIPENPADTIYSTETTDMEYTLADGTVVTKENVPYISVYNLTAENATDPDADNYHPHAIDVTGYDFDQWYLCDTKTEGYKMVVTISYIEATDDVQWGRSTTTNHADSGLWLPADANGNRELLLAFDQPTTIFVERAYVLDYGKEFELSGWYFDSEDGNVANAIHVDCDIENGMNRFDAESPTTVNGQGYGNTLYGNVQIKDGKATYTPVTTQWGGYDQFYIFGNTWRKTVLAQDANRNGDGNLWNKVTVIPANNVYFEDSFVTQESDGVNSFSGFEFTGDWQIVYTGDDPANAGNNKENPEHLEDLPYGDVHGWTDSLGDDIQFSDGSAHVAGVGGTLGAKAIFRFTGTGVDVYTRTNQTTGNIVAVLTRKDTGATPLVKSLAMDNLAMSGDYYQIPTVSFTDLPYGTYEVMLIATAASDVATGSMRYEYYLDGIRVYNPLGSVFNNAQDVVKDAYGKELNPVFTEIRDVMLSYGDFNYGIDDNGQMGAVFIDWIKDGQESGADQPGIGSSSYEVGTTFNTYGPKNEIYLTQGQAIVLKVDPDNNYYVGMKTLTPGKAALVNVSGLDLNDPAVISVGHTTDMYYEVTPMDGYIVIQNCSEDGALLALTKLRTTNMYATTTDSGIQSVTPAEAVAAVTGLNDVLENEEANSQLQNPQPIDPSVAESIIESNKQTTQQLFTDVQTWLQAE